MKATTGCGVVIATYIEQLFAKRPPRNVQDIREVILEEPAVDAFGRVS